MDYITTWGDLFRTTLNNVGHGVAQFVPLLIIAVIIFAIGWVLAALLEKLVESIFRALKIDSALRGAGTEEVVKRAGYNLNSGAFVGGLVKWFVIVVFLMSSLDLLGLSRVNDFIKTIINYLPDVIVAVLVLMVSAVLASTLQKVIVASAHAAHVRSAELLGRIAKWAIWIFAIMAALMQLNILTALFQTILTSLFAGIALALGLAFGLGGKDVAAKMIEKTSHTIFEKE